MKLQGKSIAHTTQVLRLISLITFFINQNKWSVRYKDVRVDAIHHPTRIANCPPTQPRHIVACPVVIQPTLLVALLASEAVALSCKAAEARFPKGCVFLAVDPVTDAVDDHVAAAKMVAKLVFQSRSSIICEGP